MLNSIPEGKYQYFIAQVLETDKNGQKLKTKNGKAYCKLRLTLLDEKGTTYTHYHFMFDKTAFEEVVASIGQPIKKASELKGHGGWLLMTTKTSKDGQTNNAVDCFLKPNPNVLPVLNPEKLFNFESGSSNPTRLNDEDYSDIDF